MQYAMILDRKTLIANQGGTAVMTSREFRVPAGATYAQVVYRIHVLTTNGAGTAQMTVSAEGSNDGEHWENISDFDATAITSSTPKGGYIGYPLVRFQCELMMSGGTAGDIMWGTFGVDANFTNR